MNGKWKKTKENENDMFESVSRFQRINTCTSFYVSHFSFIYWKNILPHTVYYVLLPYSNMFGLDLQWNLNKWLNASKACEYAILVFDGAEYSAYRFIIEKNFYTQNSKLKTLNSCRMFMNRQLCIVASKMLNAINIDSPTFNCSM